MLDQQIFGRLTHFFSENMVCLHVLSTDLTNDTYFTYKYTLIFHNFAFYLTLSFFLSFFLIKGYIIYMTKIYLNHNKKNKKRNALRADTVGIASFGAAPFITKIKIKINALVLKNKGVH